MKIIYIYIYVIYHRCKLKTIICKHKPRLDEAFFPLQHVDNYRCFYTGKNHNEVTARKNWPRYTRGWGGGMAAQPWATVGFLWRDFWLWLILSPRDSAMPCDLARILHKKFSEIIIKFLPLNEKSPKFLQLFQIFEWIYKHVPYLTVHGKE